MSALARMITVLTLALAIVGHAPALHGWYEPLPPLSITAPLEGTTLAPGQMVTIEWEGGDPSWLVDVYFIEVTPGHPFQVVAVLVNSHANTGSYMWEIPSDLPFGGPCDHDYVFYVQEVNQIDFRYGPTVTVVCVVDSAPPTCLADMSQAELDFFVNGEFVVTEGENFIAYFIGEDPEGDALTAWVDGLPGAILTPTSGPSPLVVMLTWSPIGADAGNAYTATVTFADPAGETADCEFTIADVNLRPTCDAGLYSPFECTDSTGELVTLNGTGSDPDSDELSYHWDLSDVILDDPDSPAPSGVFPIGVTTAILTVTDGRGGVCVAHALITVHDTVVPEVMCTTSLASLWPPKHNMRQVSLIVTATDACEEPDFIFPITVTVRSDEPDNANGNGDGNTTGDVNGQDGFTSPVDVASHLTWNPVEQWYEGTIQLRAERAGSSDGRCYTIDVMALDSALNAAIASCCVVVPHDRRGGGG